MGLLDFDDQEILSKQGLVPRDKPWYERRRKEDEFEDNFAKLQNAGHIENSADFADSAFADRKPEDAPEKI